MLEAARASIDQDIVTPGDAPHGPPGIEQVGQFMAMPKPARAFPDAEDVRSRVLVLWLPHMR